MIPAFAGILRQNLPSIDPPVSARQGMTFLGAVIALYGIAVWLGLEIIVSLAVPALLMTVLLLRSTTAWVTVIILGYIPIMWAWTEDFTTLEMLHALLLYGGLAWWFFRRIVIERLPVRWSMGGILYTAVFLQAVLMTPVSLLGGAQGFVLVREFSVLAGWFLFIPIAHDVDSTRKKQITGGAFLLLFVVLAVKNIYQYREKVVSALYFWQVGGSRQSEGYLIFLVMVFVAAAYLVHVRSIRGWLVWVTLFSLSAVATVLTFYRTIWVTASMGLVLMGLLTGTQYWKRTALNVVLAVGVLVVIYPLIFSRTIPITTIWESIVERFSSIQQYGTDISLKNREAETAKSLTDWAPAYVLGRGLSTELVFKKLTSMTTIRTTWTHNGYAWALFHFGILGTLLLLGAYAAFLFKGVGLIRKLRTRPPPGMPGDSRHGMSAQRLKTFVAACVTLSASIFLISLTTNQFLGREQALVYALLWGFLESWDRDVDDQRSLSTL